MLAIEGRKVTLTWGTGQNSLTKTGLGGRVAPAYVGPEAVGLIVENEGIYFVQIKSITSAHFFPIIEQ
jgi:hypothetical protein